MAKARGRAGFLGCVTACDAGDRGIRLCTAPHGVRAMEGFRSTIFIVLAAATVLGAGGQNVMNGTLFRYGSARMSAAFMTGAAPTLSPVADCRSLLPCTNRGRQRLCQGHSRPGPGTLFWLAA